MFSVVIWLWLGFPLILFVICMDLKVQPGEKSIQLCFSALCREWCGSVDIIKLTSSTTWVGFFNQGWSSRDQGQHLHMDHGSLPENHGLLPPGWEWVTAPSKPVQVLGFFWIKELMWCQQQALHRTKVGKWDLSLQMDLSIFWPSDMSIAIYGLELCVVTDVLWERSRQNLFRSQLR